MIYINSANTSNRNTRNWNLYSEFKPDLIYVIYGKYNQKDQYFSKYSWIKKKGFKNL